jgi:hypothetical protein
MLAFRPLDDTEQEIDKSDEEKCRLYFNLFDVDGSGLIELEELKISISCILLDEASPLFHVTDVAAENHPASVSNVTALFQAIDSSNDGVIDYQEFQTFYEAVMMTSSVRKLSLISQHRHPSDRMVSQTSARRGLSTSPLDHSSAKNTSSTPNTVSDTPTPVSRQEDKSLIDNPVADTEDIIAKIGPVVSTSEHPSPPQDPHPLIQLPNDAALGPNVDSEPARSDPIVEIPSKKPIRKMNDALAARLGGLNPAQMVQLPGMGPPKFKKTSVVEESSKSPPGEIQHQALLTRTKLKTNKPRRKMQRRLSRASNKDILFSRSSFSSGDFKDDI